MNNQGSKARRVVAFVALLCALSSLGSAQRYSFRLYSQGLGNLNITAIEQDRVGYLWVGTQNGLYRYDGSLFLRYGSTDGMPDRNIDNNYLGQDGTLLVAAPVGVYFRRTDGRFGSEKLPCSQNEFTHPTGSTFTSVKQD